MRTAMRSASVGCCSEKVMKKIMQAIAANPEGLWVRELARIAKLDKSTVSLYLRKWLWEDLEIFHGSPKPFKLVRLKAYKHDESGYGMKGTTEEAKVEIANYIG